MREMRKYRDYLIEELSDPEEVTVYLEVSKEEYQKDGDAVAFLLALQSIAEAQAGNNELVSQVYLLSGDVHRSRGEYDLATEDYDTVIKLTNTVIETDPNNAEAYIRRGIAYHHKGEYGYAIANFTKAIELDPSISQLYLARGMAYHQKDEYSYAIEDVTKAIDLNPDNAEAYKHRALAYQSKGDYDRSKSDYDRAIIDFTKAIDLNPKDTNAYCGRGLAYQSKGDYDRSKDDYDHAIADFTKATNLNPNDAVAYSGRGYAYQSKGDYENAIKDCTKAVALSPNDAKVYNHRGIIYYYKGDYDRAISDYAEAVSLNPDYARAYNNRGTAYCDKGEVDLAIMDFNKAIQLNSNYAEAYYNRGVAYRVKSLMDRAIKDYNRAIQLKPNYADIYKKHWETWPHPEVRKGTGSVVNPLEGITEIDTLAGMNVSKWSTSHTLTEMVEGITKIAVSGFKSLAEECVIDIRPLTILAGANSSGKSSIMQPLLMLKQTLEATFDSGPLLIDGPNVQFTLAEQFFSKLIGEERADRFQIQIETCGFGFSYSVRLTFSKELRGIEIVEMTKTESKYQLLPPEDMTLYPRMPPEEIKSLAGQHWITKDFDTVRPARCFLRFESQDGHRSLSITPDLESHISNSIHLPGLRGNPERTYKLTSTGPRYPGTFENYTASIIHEWQETTDKRLKTLADALHTLGLTGQVGTKKIDDTRIELQVGRLPLPPASGGEGGGTDMVSIADVGFGVSQVLPVLVALIVAEPGQLVYLEQPEMHLHPRAQVALAQVLAAAAKRGVRVVAETHSSLLLLAVQTLVAEGDLSPELVKLHWFTRDENGATKIDTADLDEAGAYGDWPEDFDDVDLKAQSRYIRAAQSRLAERV